MITELVIPEMNAQLIVPENTSVEEVFTTKNGLDPLLNQIRTTLDNFKPDLSTAKGRKEIASMARKVSSSKTHIDSIGKDLAAALKEKPKLIDAERSRVKKMLDDWRDEIRKPLTDWEIKEKERLEKHHFNMQKIKEIKETAMIVDSSSIKTFISQLKEMVVDESWEEFEKDAFILKTKAIEEMSEQYNKKLEEEEKEKELERLRQEEAVRKAKERDERIAKEAKEKAERDAAELAKREKEKARIREEQLKLEKEKAEKEKQEYIEKVEREKKEAALREEKRIIEAKEKAEKEKALAVKLEKERIERERKEAEEVEKARVANLEHRKKIEEEVVDALIDNDVEMMTAYKVVSMISKGEIKSLMINY
jgi:hypothetical protein